MGMHAKWFLPEVPCKGLEARDYPNAHRIRIAPSVYAARFGLGFPYRRNVIRVLLKRVTQWDAPTVDRQGATRSIQDKRSLDDTLISGNAYGNFNDH